MEAFTTHKGLVASLDRANVDTDAIIPKQFLKSIKRTGFGESLFFDWRYNEDGSDNPDFELNALRFRGASILVARNNFGCGSSREHAVWAVVQYGLRAIIAPMRGEGDDLVPGFADIFRNNCSKNGLLTIQLSEDEVEEIFQLVAANEGLEASIDLQTQTITFHAPETKTYSYDVDPTVKHNLLNGLDDIGLTLQHLESIEAFEVQHDTQIATV